MTLKPEVKDFINKITFDKDGKQIDIVDILKKLNLKVSSVEFDDPAMSGAIVRENGEWRILVKYDEPKTRQRFTVAHELGHFISYKSESYSYQELSQDGAHFDTEILSFTRKNTKKSKSESEANEIAAEILMPQEHVEKCIKQNLTLQEIASKFFVSESAVAVRLNRLGYLVT
jgi:Zn-dependent peptidase ImmA (M78 family)